MQRGSLGVGEDLGRDLPGLRVWNVLLVDEDSHKLWDGKGWVSVVHYYKLNVQVVRRPTLNANIVWQLSPGLVKLGKSSKNVLQISQELALID